MNFALLRTKLYIHVLRINNIRYHEHKRTILLFTTHWFSRFSRKGVSNDCLKCLISHLFIPCLVFIYWYCKISVLNDVLNILDIENIGMYDNNSIATVASLGNMHKWIILISKHWLWAWSGLRSSLLKYLGSSK